MTKSGCINPYLSGSGFWVHLESGAIQHVRGIIDQGIWKIQKFIYVVDFEFENEVESKEIPAEFAASVNWELIKEKWANGDYTNLPARKDFVKMKIQDFLMSIGVLEVQVIPNQFINGQPAQQLIVKDEYGMHYTTNTVDSVVEIEDAAC